MHLKELLIALYQSNCPYTLISWADFKVFSAADITNLPDTDEGTYGLAGNLITDIDEAEPVDDDEAEDKWYKQYVYPITELLNEHYKP